ncbi:hypothetical protein NE237_024392 [Protea cynaroides]|uniref:Prolyl 4-hydroxylase alpha subunit n=1 Tax=Protea cynaroides TaxID=273540 RepID=A0A9Q0HDT6_9MAGN|nr:hypothetical protein NE237_024392 [Protea cynaroides]
MAKGRYSRIPNRGSSSYTLLVVMFLVLFLVLLILLAFGIFSIPVNNGDSLKANDLSSVHLQNVIKTGLGERGDQWTEVVSWEPRAFIYHNFLSKEECEYLVELAKPFMEKSTVVDSETGQSMESRVRTSSGTFLERGRDKIIRDIEKRIADFTFIPVGMQFGEQYVFMILVMVDIANSISFHCILSSYLSSIYGFTCFTERYIQWHLEEK